MNTAPIERSCSFCGNGSDAASQLFAGPAGVAICGSCSVAAMRSLKRTTWRRWFQFRLRTLMILLVPLALLLAWYVAPAMKQFQVKRAWQAIEEAGGFATIRFCTCCEGKGERPVLVIVFNNPAFADADLDRLLPQLSRASEPHLPIVACDLSNTAVTEGAAAKLQQLLDEEKVSARLHEDPVAVNSLRRLAP